MLACPSNIGPPSLFTFRIAVPIGGPDLTTATAVSILVRRTDTSTATWAATIVSAAQDHAIIQYAIQNGDITVQGVYQLTASVVLPGGPIPSTSLLLRVTTPYSVPDDARLWGTFTLLGSSSALAGAGPGTQWTYVSHAPIAEGTAFAQGSPYSATPFAPVLAVDLSHGAVTVVLWNPGPIADEVILVDFRGQAGVNACTVNAAAGTSVPTGVGTYGATVNLTTPGFGVRWKYSPDLTLWIPKP
jgi:hypothetical protein